MSNGNAKATATVLLDFGPAILKERFQYGKTAKDSQSRLEWAPKGKDPKDPHVMGRALDIVLVAWKPNEKRYGDALVALCLRMQTEMHLETIIYNKVEWNSAGSPSPRIASPDMTPAQKYDFEHTSHVHIQWYDSQKDQSDFIESLVYELQNDATLQS